MAQILSRRLGLHMVDGDDLHMPESVAKMSAGIALQDADRWPWLDRIGDHLASYNGCSTGCVVACSALRHAYRERIRARAGGIFFLFLSGDHALIAQRMRQRSDHYMPTGLLESQFRTLETPSDQETDVITLDIREPVELLIDNALAALHAQRGLAPQHTLI